MTETCVLKGMFSEWGKEHRTPSGRAGGSGGLGKGRTGRSCGAEARVTCFAVVLRIRAGYEEVIMQISMG